MPGYPREAHTANQLWARAYHEAGHAVTGLILGVALRDCGASIVRENRGMDQVGLPKGFSADHEIDRSEATRIGMERKALIYLVGEQAQREFQASSFRRHQPGTDWRNAMNLMAGFCGSQRELGAYLRWLQIRAQELVTHPPNWAMIEAVANALIERKELTCEEIGAIVYWARNDARNGGDCNERTTLETPHHNTHLGADDVGRSSKPTIAIEPSRESKRGG
jgi:hypothetical protein